MFNIPVFISVITNLVFIVLSVMSGWYGFVFVFSAIMLMNIFADSVNKFIYDNFYNTLSRFNF